MNKNNFLIWLFIIVFSFGTYGQETNKSSKKLELSGNMETVDKSNYEVANCIANSAMIMGVTSYTESEKDALDSSFVEGNHSFSYFVDDYDSEAGNISFNYSYKIKNGVIVYKFYDFEHDGTDTDFESIGLIPEKWNEEVGEIFTEEQYNEIMKDLFANSANLIRMVNKYCVK